MSLSNFDVRMYSFLIGHHKSHVFPNGKHKSTKILISKTSLNFSLALQKKSERSKLDDLFIFTLQNMTEIDKKL